MGAQPLLLGVEVGTSAVKAVLYDCSGEERSSVHCTVTLRTPRAGWVEQDAEELWQAFCTALRAVALGAAEQGDIAALALAAQAGSVTAVDAAGEPLMPFITWLDHRAQPIVERWVREGRAAHIRRLSGWPPHAGLPLATLAWLVQQAPEVATRAVRFLDVHSYVLQRLTGHPVTDFSGAAEMLLLERASATWSEELCALAGVRPDQLPDPAQAGTGVGRLAPEAARATGLPADLLVVVGGQDQCCAALGMGVTEVGRPMLATGTAWVLTILTPDLAVEQLPASAALNFHVLPGLHTLSQLLGGFGAVMTWWMQMLWPEATDRFARWEAALESTSPGAHGLRFAPMNGSAQLGAGRGGFVGLRLDHTHAEMVRALCEGMGYEVRWALEILGAAVPRNESNVVAPLLVSGGATRSRALMRLLADLTGHPVHGAPDINWPARGAAILAGVRAGLLGSDPGAAARAWRRPMTEIAPDASFRAEYLESYADYRAIVSALQDSVLCSA
ncbi:MULTISPECIES: xylulokinase [Caldilinea]|jgi:xylulokinase|uniref:Gluconokinase n=1 Tax=Caldilinea aerophila (strain DSM 14535 / JCM 11387 / NBRC 104270 / STL-6-O1) TaxID=926550 RepID=I0I6S9_CALAS|nr:MULTISPECIES: FGGY family carbohydrate kinase [Caldilinea]BAM00967.1 gluconokinase [Caldilinea aerophila DSM 14535 = NBRC 104270]GIV72305.1 MAG: xylulokinase [Caldilinea sp.]